MKEITSDENNVAETLQEVKIPLSLGRGTAGPHFPAALAGTEFRPLEYE